MYINDLDDETLSGFFIQDPNLCAIGLDDYDLTRLFETGSYHRHENSSYHGVYEDGELLAVYKYEWFTTTTINAHLYLATKHHNKRMPQKILTFLIELAKEQLPAKKVVILTPSVCTHVQHSAEKCGFKLEGTLTDAIIWRQELVNLLIYGLSLTEE